MMLEIQNLSFRYDQKPLIDSLFLSVKRGEIVSLIGTSGSGKTTIFRLITGLLYPLEGSISINGEKLPQSQDSVTYMTQEDFLLPWRTVLQNLLLFTELGHKKTHLHHAKSSLESEALKLLEKVGLKGYEKLYPHQLSGGMRHRVSLARALLQNRPLLLLDEPFGSLDILIREELYTLLQEIRKAYQKTILLITHDFRDALSLSDRIVTLSNGSLLKEFTLPEDFAKRQACEAIIMQQIRSTLLTPSFQ